MELIIKQGYKQTEVGLIPEDWKVKALGDVGDVQMCKRIFSYQTSKRGDVPFYKIGTFGKEPDAYIDWDLYQEFRKKYSFPKKGYLLISASGTIGRTVEYLGEDAYYQDSNIIWIDNDEKLISNKYLNYTLQVVKYNTEGSTIKRLYNSIIKSSRFVIPPTLTEQKAIATALSDVDELISSLEQLITKKKAIKQGAMQQLLTPNKDWSTKTIKEVAIYRRGSFPQPYGLAKWYDDISGMPFVQVVDVDKNKKLKAETKQKISEEGAKMSVFVKKGTIILTIQGSIGRICITQYDSYVDRTLLIFESFKENFNTYFFMITVWLKFQIEKENAPGGIIKTITKEALSSFEISFPNRKEQNRIAEILENIDKELQELESKKAKYQAIKQGMMQELLTGKTRLV
jgi:type I restriction enzyme S subunit